MKTLNKKRFNEMLEKKMAPRTFIDNDYISAKTRNEYYHALNAFLHSIKKDAQDMLDNPSNSIIRNEILTLKSNLRYMEIIAEDEEEKLIFNDSLNCIFSFVDDFYDYVKENRECIKLMQIIYKIVEDQYNRIYCPKKRFFFI